jgi:hypothetical protein
LNLSLNMTVKWAAITFLSFSLFGCDRQYVPVLDLHRSNLVTPTGSIPIEVATEEHLLEYRVNHKQRLIANYQGMVVRVGVLAGAHLMIYFTGQEQNVQIVDGESYYRRNSGDRIPLDVTRAKPGSPLFWYELPPPLPTYEIYLPGGNLIQATVEKIKEGEGDEHTLYIPFRVDGKAFAIDLEFEVSLDSHLDIGVPGMP